jgi:hypothetical protein
MVLFKQLHLANSIFKLSLLYCWSVTCENMIAFHKIALLTSVTPLLPHSFLDEIGKIEPYLHKSKFYLEPGSLFLSFPKVLCGLVYTDLFQTKSGGAGARYALARKNRYAGTLSYRQPVHYYLCVT